MRYIPIDYSPGSTDILDTSSAYIQAAQLLDLAGQLAFKKDDLPAMLAVAEMWCKMAIDLGPGEETEEEEENISESVGFQNQSLRITDEPDDSESGIEVTGQSRRFPVVDHIN